jgi:hypothetical protein
MTEEAWARGMAELSILPLRDIGDPSKALLGRIMREELRHLTDEVWFFAVREAIRKERWFPPVSALLEYAGEYNPAVKLLPPGRDDEQRAQDREMARRGLEEIRRRCPWLAEEPVQEMEG